MPPLREDDPHQLCKGETLMLPKAEDTSDGCMRLAFQAILRGDYTERDRLCQRAQALISAEREAHAVERVMSVDFYVTRFGVSIPTKHMARVAGAVQ